MTLLMCTLVLISKAQTYQYDQSGRLIADASEQIASIEWNNQSKIVKLTRTSGSTKPDLEFIYDVSGNRLAKIVKPRNTNAIEPQYKWIYTYYEHDLEGMALAIYSMNYEQLGESKYVSKVEKISSAMGGVGVIEKKQEMVRQTFTASIGGDGRFQNKQSTGVLLPSWDQALKYDEKGLKQFEMANHLGDVTVIVNDRKLVLAASVRQATDYYSFGMSMPGRNSKTDKNYRYGFNGAERDDEVRDEDGAYNFTGRSIYDPRLARFVSVDPLWRSFFAVSPYSFGNNSPVFFSDQSGEQPGPYREYVRMNKLAADIKKFSNKLDKDGLDAFKTKGWINESTTNKEKFIYGAIDQMIEEIKVLDPSEWKEAMMALGELASGIATGDISGDDIFDGLVMAAGNGVDHLRASMDPNDPEFYYKNGQNAAAAATVLIGSAKKIRNFITALRKTGCFVGDTEILTAGNKFVYIKDISVEKEIYKLSDEDIKLLEEERAALEYVVEVTLENIEFTVEEDQLFIVNDEWKKAIDLVVGDKLLKLDGTTIEIKSVRKIKKATILSAAGRPVVSDQKE